MLINDDQMDALKELFHISNGRAAASLSELVGERIDLRIPAAQILTAAKAVEFLKHQYSGWVSSIKMSFEGIITGDSYLLLNNQSSTNLIKALFGDMEIDYLSVSDESALTEIANILLNAYMGTLSNLLHGRLIYDLPKYKKEICMNMRDNTFSDNADNVMLIIDTTMSVQDSQYDVSILIIMNVASITKLKNAINTLTGAMNY